MRARMAVKQKDGRTIAADAKPHVTSFDMFRSRFEDPERQVAVLIGIVGGHVSPPTGLK
jgi:hypothetical protein